MITKWAVANFKSFDARTDLAFSKLTVLTGANSSGKSTVLQPLLLLAQTFSSRTSSPFMVLNGPLLQLGSLSDIRSFGSTSPDIMIGVELQPQPKQDFLQRHMMLGLDSEPDQFSSVSLNLRFQSDKRARPVDLGDLYPRLSACEIVAETNSEISRIGLELRQESGSQASDSRVNDRPELRSLGEIGQEALRYSVEIDSVSSAGMLDEQPETQVEGCYIQHCMPARLLVSFDQSQRLSRSVTQALVRNASYGGRRAIRGRSARLYRVGYFVLPPAVNDYMRIELKHEFSNLVSSVDEKRSTKSTTNTVGDWLDAIEALPSKTALDLRRYLAGIEPNLYGKLLGELPKMKESESQPLPSQLSASQNFLSHFFRMNIRYLGPLRESPKPLYERSASIDSTDVGLRGENTAAVLDVHRTSRVMYLAPPSVAHSRRSINEDIGDTVPLSLAVGQWLSYLQVADTFKSRDLGKLGHELKVTTPGVTTPHDLTNVGVGVSQVLPIIVMCLLAPFDSTIVLEQPELHLHPAVQSRLADFFLAMAKIGKQCIIETHSEYLLNRLRLRTVEAEDESVSGLIQIYFVERESGRSHCRPVRINEFGAIPDWPQGFFDQSPTEAEAILRAAIAKKKQLRARGGL